MLGKDELLQAIAGKNRGLLATETDKTAILSAVARLEDRNPTPNPIEAAELLEGNWRLLYTTSDELLGIDRFPVYNLGQIYQCIRVKDRKIYNIAELRGIPYLEGMVSVAATFQPTSTRRVDVKFQRFVVGLQRLIGYQNPDAFIEAMESGKKFFAVDFEITPGERSGWLEITYLDEDLRIGRGNVGSVFVLSKV
ncbi:fibrillin [Leptolyngbya valderiana BDU 20041]|uniref:PAP/fibrillin family protein n=1 Tax=Baaleninema simplex TaxID=2862350 RepID=UPI000344FA2F|nr:PAP/fibrillin family protein [Baaleninema simplex]MDC0834553.1 PAP/fibrillin family protein [Geitlerinema sp. CS-897]OAB60473.1 fibrillin [Leptolyngbya valderiana BDU 20041]PPT10620.1 fibrillin [Geitlerinema sp. FC II]